MKKQILVLAALIGVFATSNAFANVDLDYVWIHTTHGNVSQGYANAQRSCGTNCLEFIHNVPGHVIRSQARVEKYNPNTPFNNEVWKKGNNGAVNGGIEFMDGTKRVYQSNVNQENYLLGVGQIRAFLTFQYQYWANGYWGAFLISAKRI